MKQKKRQQKSAESFFERAKRVINENKELFIALEELDRTGKLKIRKSGKNSKINK